MPKVKLIDGVEFRQVPGFPGYFVSAAGRLMSYRRYGPGVALSNGPREFRYCANCRGYIVVGLRRNGKRYSMGLHRIVLETFVGARPPGQECRHLDGNKENNALSNLAWGTQEENLVDRHNHGRHYTPRGEHHGNSKLTNEQVIRMRNLAKTGRFTYAALGQRFGVTERTASRVARRLIWTHIS